MLMAACVAVGVILATDWNKTPFGLAGPDVKLGAAAAPVTPSNEITAIDNAFVAVSSAVTPQVVSITSTSKVTTASDREEEGGDDPMDMHRFFFGPMPDQPQQGSGSGVIVSSDGYILTNNHVVAGGVNGTLGVQLNDGREFEARLIGRDSLTDLAVIKIDGKDLPTASFGNSDDLKVGGLVLAVGNPLGLTNTVTQGIVSALGRGQLNLNRDRDGYGIEDFIQTDAAINPGNSGGGLFNLRGELIGINSAIATRTGYYQGYGFAIPINLARAVAEDLIEDGRVNRGYIGVTIKNVDAKLAKGLGLAQGQGVLVSDLVPGGAGEAAGLRPNDVILEVDGQSVNTSNHLQSMVARRRAGHDVKLKIYRDGTTLEKTVRLKSRDEYDPVAQRTSGSRRPEMMNPSTGATDIPRLGLSVRMLDSRTARERKVESGVAVDRVQMYGEAFNEGIREGDVIVSVNRKSVKSPNDIASVVESASPGEILLLQLKRREGSTDLVALEVKK